MKCERCGGGPLIETYAYDESARIVLMRCIVCGDRTDDVILFHRSLPEPPSPHREVSLPVWDPTFRRLFESIESGWGRHNGWNYWMLNGGDYEAKRRTPSINRMPLARIARFRMMSAI